MSHFTRLKTQIVEQEYLLKALQDLGHSVEQGDVRVRAVGGSAQKAELKIHLGERSYPILIGHDDSPDESLQFGNSRGVRIPRPLLQQAGIVDEVTMEVRDGEIVIRRREADPRAGWAEGFAAMVAEGQDEAPIPGANLFDHEEWTW